MKYIDQVVIQLSLTLKSKTNENTKSRSAIEGTRLIGRITQHDNRYGAKSSITFGQPESCKTTATASIAEYFMNHHPNDYIFWRSALNAPIQVFKLPKWHLWVEKDSGIRFFDRNTSQDITEQLKKKRKITYFQDFNDLLKKAKPGICNGIFFKDLHYKRVKIDQGILQWFRFIRDLLHRSIWYFVFLDEYQEMVKAGNGERMYWEIDKHSNDVSSARKSNVGIHANAHQTSEVDWRVISGFMIILQMYGSRSYKYSPVSKAALATIKKPTEQLGAEAWISEGGHFGKITFKKIYVLPDEYNIEARIISEYEKTKVCPICNHIFRYKRKDQIYCCRACQEKDARRKRQQRKKK